jgi:hypothetical protein
LSVEQVGVGRWPLHLLLGMVDDGDGVACWPPPLAHSSAEARHTAAGAIQAQARAGDIVDAELGIAPPAPVAAASATRGGPRSAFIQSR